MYPNQPTPPPSQLPTDYLNQIAPQAPKKPLFTFGLKQIIIIGGALVVLVIILALIVNTFSAGSRGPMQHLSARLTATATITKDAQANLKTNKLRTLNSNLQLYMTNTNRDIVAPLKSVGVDIQKLDKKIVTEESTESLAARLEDARLNAVYDRTYAREMTYQLATILTLMNQIYSSTKSSELKIFLKSSYDNLKPTQEALASFSTATDQ